VLNSAITEARRKRVRAIRLVLDKHWSVMDEAHERTTGCDCGWKSPTYLGGGGAWREHLADVLAEVV
jgi:hypothetical protein